MSRIFFGRVVDKTKKARQWKSIRIGGILGIFHQNAIKSFSLLYVSTHSASLPAGTDSKLAPPEKAIRSDNFSKQMPYIPEPSVCDKMAKVIAAYFTV